MNKPSLSAKLLVVDPQSHVLAGLCATLESAGYTCVEATSSAQALEYFREDEDIGVVLCNLAMPRINGIQLIHELNVFCGKGRVFESILLTDGNDRQDVVHALRAGISDFFQMPVAIDELLLSLQRLELRLQERQKSYQHLGHLNQKLQLLSESIDGLYQDLDKVRRTPNIGTVYRDIASEHQEIIPALFNQLSPRQLDVARLVSKGQTNYQIACDLGITENTVKLYVSQVLRLTHMHNRTQLALALAPGQSDTRLKASAH